MTAEPSGWNAYVAAVIRIETPRGVMWVRPAPITRTAGEYPDSEARAIHVLTAHNPGGKIASATANTAAEAKLAAELERRKLTWWPAAGGNPSWTHVEPGAAVIGIDEADAVALGAEFGQDAIFVLTPVNRRVVGCTDNQAVTTGWATEPDTGAAERSLSRLQVPESHIVVYSVLPVAPRVPTSRVSVPGSYWRMLASAPHSAHSAARPRTPISR